MGTIVRRRSTELTKAKAKEMIRKMRRQRKGAASALPVSLAAGGSQG
jgi:hypothetical protein